MLNYPNLTKHHLLMIWFIIIYYINQNKEGISHFKMDPLSRTLEKKGY